MKNINPKVLQRFCTMLRRQEMYLSEVEKGKLTKEQILLLFKYAVDNVTSNEVYTHRNDDFFTFDDDGVPVEATESERKTIFKLRKLYMEAIFDALSI